MSRGERAFLGAEWVLKHASAGSTEVWQLMPFLWRLPLGIHAHATTERSPSTGGMMACPIDLLSDAA